MPLTPGWLFTAEALAMTKPGELWVAGWGHPAVQLAGAGSDPPAIGVTRDGGVTWQSLCWPDAWPSNGTGNAVAFRSSLGFVVGQLQSGPFVLRTTDGGATWQTITLPGVTRATGGANCGFADVAIIDDHNVWIAGAGGVYRSGDAGRSFTRESIPNDGPCAFARVTSVDPDHVWVTGSNRIARTTDGGTTWTEVGGARCRVAGGSRSPF
ncbi:MAG: hypothetical protein LC792_21285 [Actinobacteria bacterium]|nr:hypothetical protein [Actinomycetota bacterium]